MKHNLLKSVILSVILLMGVSNAWASLVGVAGDNPNNYTVKINVNRTYKDGGNDWLKQNMNQAPKSMTFEGKKLYIIGYGNTNMNGVQTMQFQYYSESTWKEEVLAIDSWQTSDNYAHPYGCIYNYDDETWYVNGDFQPNFNFYFDATGWNQTSLCMCIGHANWHNYDQLTKIPNTNLYYGTRTTGWGGAAGMCVVGNTTEGEGGNLTLLTISQNATEFTGFRNYILKSAGNTAYLMINKGNAGQRPDINYYDNFDKLNYTQTIKTVVKHGANDYTTENSKATISIKSYKITGNGVATEQNNSLTATSSTTTISAAHTATTTLTISNIETGYKFDGWYDAATGGNRLSSDPTYTYYPTEAKTVYARFSEDNIFVVRGGEQFGDTWGSNVNVMTKKNEFEQIVYYTVSITGRNLEESNTAYQFKIYDEFTGEWYGLEADDLHFWYNRGMGEKNLVEGDNGKKIELRADVPGEYVIKVDYSNTNQPPKITITYPEKHTVTLHPVSNDYGYSDFGYFIIEYEGMRYTSSPTETIRFDVASGSTITIVESQHRYPDVYNGDIIWRVIGGEYKDWKNINNPINYPITVDDDIEIGENFVISKEAAESKNLHVFLRIKKDLMDEWTAKDKAENPEYTGEGDTEYTREGYKSDEYANFIWLKDYGTPGHIIQGSTPEERGCPSKDPNELEAHKQPVGHFLMHDLKIDDDKYNYYYCTITDSCWFHIKFERKHADSDPGRGGFFEVRAGYFPGDGNNCYSIDNYSDGKFTGSWVESPKCKVTLGYTDIGRFGVKYKGETVYEEKTKEEDGNRDETYVYVDFKDEIEIVDADPGNDAFAKSLVHIDETGKKTKLDFSEQNSSYTYQITGDVKVDDLFGTKQNYTIYIGIPKNQDGFEDWDLACTDPNHNGDQMYIWCHWPYGGFGGYENYGNNELIKRTTSIETEEMIYYQFELPQGVYAFAFQCKENKDKDNSSKEHATSVYQYNPPLTTADCFVLDGGKSGKNGTDYTGYWTSMPSNGDFRLLYVEQIVTKKEEDGDEWITEVKRTYQHPSDIVKPHELDGDGRIVSLHIYTRGQNPEVILQKYSDAQKKWIDIEAHMVNGPLEATPGMGMLPGRKNAGPGSVVDDFVYDDGIEKIKNDDEDDGCGVWDFTIKKIGDNVQLDLENGLKRYEGKYYIRTTNAEGEWMNYTLPSNHMTFSPYAKQHHGEYFSHYFCKWVDINKHYRDVSFIIANDHAQNLTDPSSRFVDNYVDNQWLPENANVRWGWSIINNKVSRAYIAGSYDGQNEFLVVNGNDTKVQLQNNINGEKGYFNDNTNWLYYADLGAQPEAQVKVTAKYNAKYQYFMGTADEYQKLIGGNFAQDQRYHPIRILYDFKEHRFVVGYHPESQIGGKDVAIETPVMLIRRHHDAPNQISFDNTARKIDAPMPAYGVITFLEEKLKAQNISKNEKMFYWVSFPFDVRISHAFGLGEYGSHWVMEEYDGEARAEEGWNIYNTFWRYITDTATTLHAGKGYVLCLNYNRVINEAFLSAENEEISLYFPSIKTVDQSTIQSRGEKEVPIPTWTGAAPQKDHNWNLIGAISYANTGEKTQQSNSKFLYEYQPDDDTYSPKSSNGYTFNALHAYMVQYAGTITWTSHIAPLSIAAKRDAENDDNMHELSLDLILNGTTQDQTFIQLEDGEATQMFDLNIDMTKIINSGSNIYSISDDNNKLAGNVIPIEETIIPLGVVTAAAGEYTFAMPNGTDGIVVELIDYETNTRTNMLLDNYTVNLGKGTFENRFALHVKPDKTTTSIVDVNTNSNGVRKFIIDGILYMQKDGVLYDAQGRCVQ